MRTLHGACRGLPSASHAFLMMITVWKVLQIGCDVVYFVYALPAVRSTVHYLRALYISQLVHHCLCILVSFECLFVWGHLVFQSCIRHACSKFYCWVLSCTVCTFLTSCRDKVILLNRLTEVINFWQGPVNEDGSVPAGPVERPSLAEVKAAFPDCSFA